MIASSFRIFKFAFEAVSVQRVLLKSGPGNRVRSACGTTPVAHLEFPRADGLILRCAGKAGNPFQTTQGNRHSCRHQEGRRGSDEVVLGPSGVSGDFWVYLGGHPSAHGSLSAHSLDRERIWSILPLRFLTHSQMWKRIFAFQISQSGTALF